ncbi:NAD-dependent epimerase/dehydratase family protein [Ornithinimicrobium pratense]|nr:NAD-dependent epimerase/dehydratase family protein [Ornithinimicrobium pratense]
MKILIIGATGDAGSRILAEALRRRHDVIVAARRPPQGRTAPLTAVE